MNEEIIIPKDFDKGLKITNELDDEFVKKINEEFEKEIKEEHNLAIDSISRNTLIDYLLECKTIYEENDIFNKNMSLGDFLRFKLVKIIIKK